jgi:hypothetical protein
MLYSISPSEKLQDQIQVLMIRANIPGQIQSVSPCATSGNNRTYRVATTNSVLVAKQYFRHIDDSRDRLGAEFNFLKYAAISAPGLAPAPLAIDREAGLGLYEFMQGDPIPVDGATLDRVQSAVSFFLALNLPATRKQARELPDASEACFSISEHLDRISIRLRTLAEQVPVVSENAAAHVCIQGIVDYWAEHSKNILTTAPLLGINPYDLLSQDQRCLSPSDFGFHNAMLMPDQTVRFLDFEYAGWDDPAKMVGDFFSQLSVPVPSEYFEDFVSSISVAFPDADQLVKRASLLRPVYQVKWCCIALNIFLPVHLARRKFANPHLNVIDLKRTQLSKAQSIMRSLTTI